MKHAKRFYHQGWGIVSYINTSRPEPLHILVKTLTRALLPAAPIGLGPLALELKDGKQITRTLAKLYPSLSKTIVYRSSQSISITTAVVLTPSKGWVSPSKLPSAFLPRPAKTFYLAVYPKLKQLLYPSSQHSSPSPVSLAKPKAQNTLLEIPSSNLVLASCWHPTAAFIQSKVGKYQKRGRTILLTLPLLEGHAPLHHLVTRLAFFPVELSFTKNGIPLLKYCWLPARKHRWFIASLEKLAKFEFAPLGLDKWKFLPSAILKAARYTSCS